MFSLTTTGRLARSLALKTHPIYVQYYVTARCNLACEQCNIIYANADVHEAGLAEVERIADNLARIGVSVVLLTGGEPFVRKDLPQIVGAFSRRGVHVRLQTNGLATRGALAACVAAGARDISISLDSLQPDLQAKINGNVPGSWHRAIEMVATVNELFPADAFSAFGCVLAPSNFRQVPDVIRFATEIGWWVSLVPAHTTDSRSPLGFRTYDRSLCFPPDLWPEVEEVLDSIHRMKRDGFHVYDSLPFMADLRRFVRGEPVRWRDRNQGVCDSPNLYFAILPNGNMAVCCDWRMKTPLSVAAPDFGERFFALPTQNEVHDIAAACPGCLFGSFAEISISSRFLSPMLQRTLLFGRADARRRLERRSAVELFALAARIRDASPGIYPPLPAAQASTTAAAAAPSGTRPGAQE